MKSEADVSQLSSSLSNLPTIVRPVSDGSESSTREYPVEELTFENYEILRQEDGSLWELGRGAMGVTYKAKDRNLHCLVALKIINTTFLRSDEALHRFQREARSCAQLRHPNIATIFHLGKSEDGSPFYAMEFCEGPTVQQWVEQQGRLEPAQALEVGLQISRALVIAEQAKVIHRDLKPANLIVTQRKDEPTVIKVIDFGLAKIGGDINAWSSISGQGFIGTANFSSPEQIEGSAIDTRSDIYSLGATLFYVLAGRPMFEGSLARIIMQHLTTTPPYQLLPSLPPGWLELLKDMLAKDPAARPSSALVLRQRFEALLNGAAPVSPAPAPPVAERPSATGPIAARPVASIPPIPTTSGDTEPVMVPRRRKGSILPYFLVFGLIGMAGAAVALVMDAMAKHPDWFKNVVAQQPAKEKTKQGDEPRSPKISPPLPNTSTEKINVSSDLDSNAPPGSIPSTDKPTPTVVDTPPPPIADYEQKRQQSDLLEQAEAKEKARKERLRQDLVKAQETLKMVEALALQKIRSANQPPPHPKPEPQPSVDKSSPPPVIESPPVLVQPPIDKTSVIDNPPAPTPEPIPPPMEKTPAVENSPWIFPDSNQRVLSADDLARITSSQQARQAINELYARKGFIFKSADGKAYAKSLGVYYHPVAGMNEDAIEASLTPVEKQNRDALVNLRARLKAHEGP